MFKSFTFNNLNTPLTYIVTAATIPSLYFVKRVSLKLSIITAFGIYIFNVISKPAPKKACCGGKNKVNGKCCSGRKDCGPKVVKRNHAVVAKETVLRAAVSVKVAVMTLRIWPLT